MFGLEPDTIGQIILAALTAISSMMAWFFNKLRRKTRSDLVKVVAQLRRSVGDQFGQFLQALDGLTDSSLPNQKNWLQQSVDVQEAIQPMLLALAEHENNSDLVSDINKFFSALRRHETQSNRNHSEKTRAAFRDVVAKGKSLFEQFFEDFEQQFTTYGEEEAILYFQSL